MAGSRTIRSLCCCLFSTLGIIIIITWIILVKARTPRFSLLALQLPIHNTTTLTFKLKVYNPNLNIGIHFSNLSTSLHYPANQSSAIADVIVPAFQLGNRKTIFIASTGKTRGGVNLSEVGGTQLIGVHVNGRVRYVSWWSRSRWHRLSVEGVAGVDAQGLYANEKGVRLKSGATMRLPETGFYLLLLLVIHTCC